MGLADEFEVADAILYEGEMNKVPRDQAVEEDAFARWRSSAADYYLAIASRPPTLKVLLYFPHMEKVDFFIAKPSRPWQADALVQFDQA